MENLSQRNSQWANTKIGNSIFFMWAKGGLLTQLAQVLGITPNELNEKLTTNDGLTESGEIRANRIAELFPEWQLAYYSPYDNEAVLLALQKEQVRQRQTFRLGLSQELKSLLTFLPF